MSNSLKFQLGQVVKQIVPIVQGEVTDMVIVDGAVQYRVDWEDVDGAAKSKFFAEGEIEAVV